MIFKNVRMFDGEKFMEKGEFEVADHEKKEVDLTGTWLIPSVTDTHAHLRDPGQIYREDLYSGAAAALHGGITTIFVMPNTTPAIDTDHTVKYLNEKARNVDVDIKVVGAITKAREGKELAEMGRMAKAGVVGFSDDGNFLQDASLARHAMEYASELGLPIISHCEDAYFKGASIREGWYSTLYGIKAAPAAAESIAVAREIELAYLTNAHVHIAHVSTARSVKLIRQAKKDGIDITCDVCVHHLLFLDEDLSDFNTFKKINPPFPTVKDQEELYRAIEDGTVDALISDHAPYADHEKEVEFQSAPAGIIGFETLLGELLMVSKKGLNIEKLLSLITTSARTIYHLEDVNTRDFTVFDPNDEWVPSKETLLSKSHNTSFLNNKVPGRVLATFKNGKQVYGDTKWKLM